MVLQIGQAEKTRFIPLLKKTNIFECGNNGIVVEREKGKTTLYVTNAACSRIFATIPLGKNSELIGQVFVVVAYSEDVMLVDGGRTRVVVDYEEKAVAVNREDLTVRGSRFWGDEVQTEWEYDYNEFFTGPAAELQK